MAITQTEITSRVIQLQVDTGDSYERINATGSDIGTKSVGTIELRSSGTIDIIFGTLPTGQTLPSANTKGFKISWNGTEKDNNQTFFTLNTTDPIFLKGTGTVIVEVT